MSINTKGYSVLYVDSHYEYININHNKVHLQLVQYFSYHNYTLQVSQNMIKMMYQLTYVNPPTISLISISLYPIYLYVSLHHFIIYPILPLLPYSSSILLILITHLHLIITHTHSINFIIIIIITIFSFFIFFILPPITHSIYSTLILPISKH